MKKLRQLLTVATLVLALGFVFMNCREVDAAPAQRVEGVVYINPPSNGGTVWKSVKKMRMEENSNASFKIYFGNAGDYISDVKVNKKGLKAGVTNQYSINWSAGTGSCYGTIGLRAEKSGTYKVSFKVRNQAGAVKKSYTMTVSCTDNMAVFKEIKIGSQTAYKRTVSKKGTTYTTKYLSNYKIPSSMTSAKLSITPNKGFSITGVIVVYRDKNGVPKTLKTKNNRNIKLSQQYNTRSYGSDGVCSKPSKMWTEVFASYKDKYLGTYVQYSVVKKSGVKMIKRVEKLSDGTKKTGYYNISYAGGNISFWRN